MTRTGFLRQVFYPVAVKARGAVVGFNLPFDLSRLAIAWRPARSGSYNAGFSFAMLDYEDNQGRRKPHPFRPRVAVKSINSKEALIGFTSNWNNRGPRERLAHRDESTFRGHFLDCRTLAYALTGEAHTLASACQAFGVEHGKAKAREHGKITTDYLNYARRDVLATWELYRKLLEEYWLHPISLLPSEAYSIASLGKAYLKAMGLQLPRVYGNRALQLSKRQVFGLAMASYYGGRAECRVRMNPVPVVYCDFLSMYPTVSALMHLWRYLTAERITVREATDEIRGFLKGLTVEDLFIQDVWRGLPGLVEVVPDGDILPIRARYSRAANTDYTIGLNSVTSSTPLWFTLADCAASKILTGKMPQVKRALRFKASGRQKNLHEVNLRGEVLIDPAGEDFFQRVIEERQWVKRDPSLDPKERERLQHFLKILANAASYGIFIQLNRQEGPETTVDLFGLENYRCTVQHPETPGAYFFPILGTLITGAARLMLALVEFEVPRMGGGYAFMDTDSIAVVATESKGLILCPGGMDHLLDGRQAIRALSWEEVERIRARFTALNPYDWECVPESILKLEDENYAVNEKGERERRELWAFVIASKRYVLFNLDRHRITLKKFSEHGLGQYLPPED